MRRRGTGAVQHFRAGLHVMNMELVRIGSGFRESDLGFCNPPRSDTN